MRRAPAGNAEQVDWTARLSAALAEFGIAAEQPALTAMRAHFELLMRWNARTNLTAIRDPEQILRRHFAESLFVTKLLKFGPGLLYDIGSGAGFPGLPLKAVHPEINLVLVESSQKKAAFLKEVIRSAGAEGAEVETARAEELAERAEVELADWITMRAAGEVEDLLPVMRRLLVPHGLVALFLGRQDAARVLNNEGGFLWRAPAQIPHSERRVILIGENLG